MAFSVSFVFKATDKYSAVLSKISSATKKLTGEMHKLTNASNRLKSGLSVVSTESNQLINRMRGNAKATGTYTASMKQATSATKAQAAAMKSLKLINGGRAAGVAGGTRTPRMPAARRSKSVARAWSNAALPMAGVGVAMIAPAVAAINEARSFETSFSNLRKVFNGTNAELAITRQNMLNLATTYPMAAEGIIKIAADASEAGIQFKELNRFTEIAIQAGVAFDMSSEEVGASLAKTKNAFKMTVEEMNTYGDQVNFLSNNQASSAKEIIAKVKEISGMSSVLHLSAANAAAFASTMIHTAQPVERVDGALKDMMRTLGSATTQPKKARAAFQNILGVPAAGIQRTAETKPLEAMMFMLKKVKELKHGKIAALSTMFGGQYSSEMAALVEHYDELAKSIKDVNNRELTRNSMLKEFQIRQKTLNNQLQQNANIIKAIAEETGRAMIPVLNELLKVINPMLLATFRWVQANPKLAAGILLIVSAIGTLAIGLAGIGFVLGGLNTLGILIMSLTGEATIAAAASAALTGALGFLGSAVAFLATPWTVIIGLATVLYFKWMPFQQLINSLINLFLAFATRAIAETIQPVKDLCNVLGTLWGMLQKIGAWFASTSLGKGIGGLLSGMAGGINDFSTNMNADTKASYGISAPSIPKYKGEIIIHHQMPAGMPAPVTKIKSSKGLSVKTGSNMN